ncbi:hypothetical protein ONZ45_g13123 [Pleurotus djamor]|nr:hypothetical protein ONZ45_g13123 [Pleurotus djamor]
MAILLLCEGAGGTRILEARQFPPPTFTDKEAEAEAEGNGKAAENTDVEDLLVETLRSMQMSSDPDSLALPLPLEYGRSLVDGRLTTLERDAHQALLNAPGDLHDQLELNGGIAWVDPSHATELKHAKVGLYTHCNFIMLTPLQYQPHRLLVTHHNDLTVHFADLSSQLLMGSEERIQSNFPSPLTHLKIDLNVVLTEPSVASHLSSPQISSTYLTSESLECLIALRTGEVFVYRPKPDNYETPMFRSSEDDELVILSHVPTHSTSKFSPHFMLAPGRGPVSAYALCDIGFLATAYADGTIYIVDMRGPRVILRYDPVENSRSRHSFALPLSRHSSSHPVGSLSWSICPLSTDPQLRVRLIAVRTTGATEIFTLTKSQIGAWSCKDSDIQTTDSVDDPIPTGSFVIDLKNGAILGATSSKLSTISRSPTGCLWVVCGAKNAKCIVDITGDQVGKARWNTKSGLVNDVQIVEKNGSRALVAMTGAHTVYVHSLPELELLHTLLLPSTRFSSLTLDSSGDFIQWQRNTQSNTISRATYGTLFNVRRTSGLPLLDFVATKKDIPPPPQPVSMGPASILGSWFSFGQSVTGDQIDTLLGGPDRPLPSPKPRQGESGTSGTYAGYSAAGIATSVSNAQTGLQMLDSLQERFSDLEQGSRDMANQAKRLAAEQTTKRWFMGFG